MLESSIFLENPASAAGGGTGGGGGGGAATNGVVVELNNGGGSGGGEEGDRVLGGNRWPREETLALLKIRSEMDLAFRDSNLKAPLWDEVARKLGELGYNRSAKKCKEKFENIYKYHKRTKEGRSGRQNGKHYRFFEQLEIFDSQLSFSSSPLNQIQSPAKETAGMVTPTRTIMAEPISVRQDFTTPCSTQNTNSGFMSTSTSSSSSSDKDSEGSFKKKRKLADYFERLMKDVLEKQEDLQNKFLEAIEKCERDRMAREEAWKVQEMARIKREQEFLAQERAIAAAKDAAVLAFLQKISQQTIPLQIPETSVVISERNAEKQENALEKVIDEQENRVGERSIYVEKQFNGARETSTPGSSSRWPKAEVEALITMRTDLELKYQDCGPKGPLWEEISSSMKRLGYDRSAKRCKEKWENINKYYKRVKESNKRRPEDSKTCPYFSMLESIYAKKLKKSEHVSDNSNYGLKPEDILMQMTGQTQPQPQSQAQTQAQNQNQQHEALTEDGDSENVNPDHEDDAEDEDDDDNAEDYQIVANNPSSVTALG